MDLNFESAKLYYEILDSIDRDKDIDYIKSDDIVDDAAPTGVSISTSLSNVVPEYKLRDIQSSTLSDLKSFLSKTFGPMGSNTKMITGDTPQNIMSIYSKDGLKVLKHISNMGVIETSIIEEIIEVTRHVEKEVGDGTTSTVILSSLIFDNLLKIQKKYNVAPYRLMKEFSYAVDIIKSQIRLNGMECNLDSIYNISMVSTNGNEEVSENIRNIYEQFGFDVDLSVGISTSEESLIRAYDGLTITEGMSDPAFINNSENKTCEIHNARIYHFEDPVDTMEMISLFEAILNANILNPIKMDEPPVPTVIVCPRISKDMGSLLKSLISKLYQYDKAGSTVAKPPILVVTNVVASDELIMDDIANLCGCKTIKKYIDRAVYEKDVQSGDAATIDTVADNFYGVAELVVADSSKTKFINPQYMNIVDEEGNLVPAPQYTAMINFLETEISTVRGEEDSTNVGLLRKRLSALKSNMVEYLVGGITISERDAKKDLVEDAIKNCASAAKYGVGYGANFEGLRTSYDAYKNIYRNELLKDIIGAIYVAYYDISSILYATVVGDSKQQIQELIDKSLKNNSPFNIRSMINGEDDNRDVLCTIMLDINVLDTISKIISMMVTCNQCLLQAPQLNKY